MKTYGDLEMEGNEIRNGRIQEGTTLPSNPFFGQLFHLHAPDEASKIFYYNGTQWICGVLSINQRQGNLVLTPTDVGLDQIENIRYQPYSEILTSIVQGLDPQYPDTVITKPGYTHLQEDSQTVWTITHNMGYDPAGIVVTSTDGYMLDGFGVQYLDPGVSLRISYDLSFAGTAILS